jgi:aryl-alcohol dehydrogenase-like predicted oxidoreductase
MKVYVAIHVRNEVSFDSRKILGVYSSKESAHRAIDAMAEMLTWESDDLDYPDLFQVDVFDLDDVPVEERLALIA